MSYVCSADSLYVLPHSEPCGRVRVLSDPKSRAQTNHNHSFSPAEDGRTCLASLLQLTPPPATARLDLQREAEHRQPALLVLHPLRAADNATKLLPPAHFKYTAVLED